MPYVAKRRHTDQGRVARLGRHPRPASSSARSCRRCSPAACSSPSPSPRCGMQFKDPGFDGYSRSQPVDPDLRPPPGRLPRRRRPGHDRRSRPRTSRPPRSRPRSSSCTTRRWPPAQLSEPSHVEISPDKTVAVVALSVKGNGTDAASERSLEVLRSEVVPATVGKLAGAEVAVTGLTAELEGLHRHHDVARADRVRVRAQPRVHPAAGHVPLDRGADQGDRPEPAVGRRGLRRARARLPGRPRREAARLPVGRRHRARGSRCSCS